MEKAKKKKYKEKKEKRKRRRHRKKQGKKQIEFDWGKKHAAYGKKHYSLKGDIIH